MNTRTEELSDNELDCVSGGNIIGDALKVIGAMADAVNKFVSDATLGGGLAGVGSGAGSGSGSASGVAPKSTWL